MSAQLPGMNFSQLDSLGRVSQQARRAILEGSLCAFASVSRKPVREGDILYLNACFLFSFSSYFHYSAQAVEAVEANSALG